MKTAVKYKLITALKIEPGWILLCIIDFVFSLFGVSRSIEFVYLAAPIILLFTGMISDGETDLFLQNSVSRKTLSRATLLFSVIFGGGWALTVQLMKIISEAVAHTEYKSLLDYAFGNSNSILNEIIFDAILCIAAVSLGQMIGAVFMKAKRWVKLCVTFFLLGLIFLPSFTWVWGGKFEPKMWTYLSGLKHFLFQTLSRGNAYILTLYLLLFIALAFLITRALYMKYEFRGKKNESVA